MVTLFLSAAGRSSRFSGKPKWLLTCPNGNLMIQESLSGLDMVNVDKIVLIFLKEHIDKYCNSNIDDIYSLFDYKNIHIKVFDRLPDSLASAICQVIDEYNITGPIFIKDCDNHFRHKIESGNAVCSLSVDNNNVVESIHNKSFIEYNNINQIVSICEKKIISNHICVGGYGFESAELFVDTFKKCQEAPIHRGELFVSHVILKCMLDGALFFVKKVSGYIDWGTQKEWDRYVSEYKTLFVDIDGTLVHNSGQFFSPKWGETDALIENCEIIRDLYKSGKVQIILTTSRKESFKEATIQQLEQLDIPYHQIVFGLFHAKRVLINDYADSNKYPSAIAINLKRNSLDLEKLL